MRHGHFLDIGANNKSVANQSVGNEPVGYSDITGHEAAMYTNPVTRNGANKGPKGSQLTRADTALPGALLLRRAPHAALRVHMDMSVLLAPFMRSALLEEHAVLSIFGADLRIRRPAVRAAKPDEVARLV